MKEINSEIEPIKRKYRSIDGVEQIEQTIKQLYDEIQTKEKSPDLKLVDEILRAKREHEIQQKPGDFVSILINEGLDRLAANISHKRNSSEGKQGDDSKFNISKDGFGISEDPIQGNLETNEAIRGTNSETINEKTTDEQNETKIESELDLIFKEKPLLKHWFKNQIDTFQKLVLAHKDCVNLIKNGYGFLIPLEIFQNRGIGELFCKLRLFKKFSLKSPELEHFLNELKEKLDISRKNMCQILGKHPASYSRIIRGLEGINIQKLVQIPQTKLIQKILKINEIEQLKKNIDQILTNPKTTIMTSTNKFSFDINKLAIQKIDNHSFVILPTSHLETKKIRTDFKRSCLDFNEKHKKAPTYYGLNKKYRDLIEHDRIKYGRTFNDFLKEFNIPVRKETKHFWEKDANRRRVINFVKKTYNDKGVAPTVLDIRGKFRRGFISYLEEKGITWNEFLVKECNVTVNIEFGFWSRPENKKLVDEWIYQYVKSTKKSPTQSEVDEKFPGFLNHLLRYKKTTWNNYLNKRGYPPNHTFEFNWKDPELFEDAKKWVISYRKKFKRTPGMRDFIKKFSAGLFVYISWNDFLIKDCGVPINEFDKCHQEGLNFDKLGKKCFKLIDKSIKIEKKIYHPIFQDKNKESVVPDGIKHDFDQRPLKVTKAGIFLNEGQRLDEILELKRTYGSKEEKDEEYYPRFAKQITYFLLIGNSNIPDEEKYGCKITYRSVDELIDKLKDKINPQNQEKITGLIQDLYFLKKGLDKKNQKDLTDYSDDKRE